MRKDLREDHTNGRFWGKLAMCAAPALLLLSLSASAQEVQSNPIVKQARNATTPLAVRDMKPEPWHNLTKVMPDFEENAPFPRHTKLPDTVVQTEVLPPVGTKNLLNFDGIFDRQGGGYVPPDTNASVGDTQVVETVNIAFAVYDKATGKQLMAPVSIQTLYRPLGGECASGNLSDPVVNYDKVANRWLITMIAFNGTFTVNDGCVAVSATSDATGKWHAYDFPYGNVLPDYPKVGVWPDAYYLTTDSYPGGGNFTGAESCALDRTKMLAGKAAKAVCFQRSSSDYAMLPADVDGSTAPPTGAPNYELDQDMSDTTKLNLYQFHVNFAKPKTSTFKGPAKIAIAAYNGVCGFNRNCIPQPPHGEGLAAIGNRMMFRLPYRNFGDHEALVATHSVVPTGKGGAVSAVRWYEIRSPGSAPAVFQSGTIGGGKSPVSKWMASIGMDKAGDIALGYSKSSKTVMPSIEYVGRVPGDPLGKMESPSLIIKGTGVQLSSQNRWGDYSSMAIDPADDCTFWYVQEYYKTTGSFNFSTRLASFKFTACK
jgi:hypothetical protein